MTASMDLFSNAPRTAEGELMTNTGLTLNFHAPVELHVTVVRHEATGQQRIGMEIGAGPVCSETSELPVTHPGNIKDPARWLMKDHPEFAKYMAQLARELEAGPSTEALDEGEPTDEDETEEQARRRWPFGRRKQSVEATA